MVGAHPVSAESLQQPGDPSSSGTGAWHPFPGNLPSPHCPRGCKERISYDLCVWPPWCQAEPRGANDSARGGSTAGVCLSQGGRAGSHSLQLWLRTRQALLGGSNAASYPTINIYCFLEPIQGASSRWLPHCADVSPAALSKLV